MTRASIVVVTYDRAALLRRTLESLVPQLEDGDQLVLVDDGSTDGTEWMVREMVPEVSYVRVEEHDGYRLSTRINQGLAVARHDLCWRLDADCRPEPTTLLSIRRAFRRDRILAGGIRYQDENGVVALPDHPWRLSFLRTLSEQEPGIFARWRETGELPFPVVCFGGNVCFSRDEALRLGGFDTDFDLGWGAEDAWFADRLMATAGVRLLYMPGIAVVHQWHPEEGEHREAEPRRRNLALWRRKSAQLRGSCRPGSPGEIGPPSGVPRERRAPYLLLSITGREMVNAGNRLVEMALLERLPPPALVASVFRAPTWADAEAVREAECRLAVCSGTTVLGDGTPLDRWAEVLSPLPLIVVGGAFWVPGWGNWVCRPNLLATARDPHTRDRLGAERDVTYVGCPSLLLGLHDRPTAGMTTARGLGLGLGFHRQDPALQVRLFSELSARAGHPVTVFVQERSELGLAREVERRVRGDALVRILDLSHLGRVVDWEEAFAGLFCCISGRLHQVLPAAAMGVPSLLVVPSRSCLRDTRYTLLEDLAMPMLSLDELCGAELLDLPARCRPCDAARLGQLRTHLCSFLDRVVRGLAGDDRGGGGA